MIQIRERQGDTLQGDIDGINVTYTTTYNFYDDIRVNIYVNGRLKIRAWDDGFSVVMPNQIVMKEPLLDGDSLEVEYSSGAPTGGGADGGCPNRPELSIMAPETLADENVPEILADDIDPYAFAEGEFDMDVLSDDLKPVIVHSEEG